MLVVEDNEDHWTLIQVALQNALPEVNPIWVADAEQAQSYLDNCVRKAQALPQMILLDLYLPEIEPTWQLLRAIRLPSSPFIRIPIVVFSQSSDRSDINELYSFGGTSYIAKPTDFHRWMIYFNTLRHYWWETVTLPGTHS